MSKSNITIFYFLFLSITMANSVIASSLLMPLNAVFSHAEFVIKGEVISKSTRWGKQHKMIWTDYKIKLLKSIKGGNDKLMVMSFAGGKVGDASIGVTDIPILSVGERYIIAGYENHHLYSSPTVGSEQGVYRILYDKNTNADILTDYFWYRVDITSGNNITKGPRVTFDGQNVKVLNVNGKVQSKIVTPTVKWVVRDSIGNIIPQQEIKKENTTVSTNSESRYNRQPISVSAFVEQVRRYQ